VQRGARAVEVGHLAPGRGEIAPLQGETHAIAVAGVAHREDAESQEAGQAGLRASEELGFVEAEVRGAPCRVELAALKEEVGVRFDQAGQRGVVRQVQVGLGPVGADHVGRRRATDVQDPLGVVDEMSVRQDLVAVEDGTKAQPAG